MTGRPSRSSISSALRTFVLSISDTTTMAMATNKPVMAGVLPEHFPLPARYAHPVVLDRMIRVLREGRAQNAEEALAVVKADLKALNADVQVSQEEYDEVVAIKPMFLVSDYE